MFSTAGSALSTASGSGDASEWPANSPVTPTANKPSPARKPVSAIFA